MKDKMHKVNDLYYAWNDLASAREDLQIDISEASKTSTEELDRFVKLVRQETHAREAYFAELNKDVRVKARNLWTKVTKRKK